MGCGRTRCFNAGGLWQSLGLDRVAATREGVGGEYLWHTHSLTHVLTHFTHGAILASAVRLPSRHSHPTAHMHITLQVVKSGVLWQMRLSVYAPLKHIAGDSQVITNTELRKSRTGIGGVIANKGGLVCRLDFAGTSLCFISAHLAAHSHKLKQRNDNCQEILRETARVAENHLDAASQFDHVFW
jgi:hypothetical protein